ncbi:MAG: hypothetical protein JST82_09040 [Bacteroidetes bacterium]|nr:hypothetical protein [Bacteroidota bacterium]
MCYVTFFFYPKWNGPGGEAAIGWDVSGYYWYLPSVVIYKDLKYQRWADSIIQKYQPTPDVQQYSRYPDSSCVMTYSSGMAFMYLPFFTAAHLLAKPLGYPPDGFSPPYQFAIQVGSLLFALLGIWYFRKLLLLYFEDRVVAVLLFAMAIGTNYLNYAAIDGGMSHSWLFTLYVFLLLNTHYFYKTPSFKYAIRIGLLSGLAILIRPSEMVAVIIPILWGMESISRKAIQEKVAFLKQHLSKILVAILCVLLVGSIQLFYWKYVSGHWLVFSYGGDDKGFDWLHPHTDLYLFSYRSGWFRYVPVALLAVLGFIPFIKKGKNKVALILFFLLNLYVVSAWKIWWYAGIGGRAMIQSYAMLFIPFGYLVQYVYIKKWLKWLFFPVLLLFSYVSVWVMIQAHKGTGLYDCDNMSKAYYWRVIGRWYPKNKSELDRLKDTDEMFEGTAKNIKSVYTNDFESDTTATSQEVLAGTRSFYLAKDKDFKISLPVTDHIIHSKWIHAEALFHCTQTEYTSWKMLQFSIKFSNKGKEIKTNVIRVHRFMKDGETKKVYIDVKIPGKEFDQIEVYTWNPGSDQTLLMDNLNVWTFDE